MENNEFKHLPNFDFSFVEMLDETNMEDLLSDIRIMLVMDVIDMKVDVMTLTTDDTIKSLFGYTTKYAFFIQHFEKETEFEKCAMITKDIVAVLSDIYTIERDTILDLVQKSVITFRENKKDND